MGPILAALSSGANNTGLTLSHSKPRPHNDTDAGTTFDEFERRCSQGMAPPHGRNGEREHAQGAICPGDREAVDAQSSQSAGEAHPGGEMLFGGVRHQGRFVSAPEFEAKYESKCPMPRYQYSFREEVYLLAPFISIPSYRHENQPCLLAQLQEPLCALLPKPEGVKARLVDSLPKAWPSEHQCEGGDRIRPIHVFESERIAPAELARLLRLV